MQIERCATNKLPVRRKPTARSAMSARRRVMLTTTFALVGALAVGGTIAWLTDRVDPVVNEFEPTEVTCAVEETFNSPYKSKTEVAVRNTGDVDAFIRAAIVVNWADKNGNIHGTVVPTADDYTLTLASSTGWTKGADGYYYCEKAIAPDGLTGTLISSCTLNEGVVAPSDYYLAIDIVVDAIQADGSDGANAPVDSWDNEKVNVTRSDDGKTISVTDKTTGAGN